jgi:hypothetical protein
MEQCAMIEGGLMIKTLVVVNQFYSFTTSSLLMIPSRNAIKESPK